MNIPVKKRSVRMRVPIICAAFVLTGIFANSCSSSKNAGGTASNGKRDYKFSQKISRKVLENYLDRSITMQSLLTTRSGNFEDNLRMIKNVGPKLIGRAVCQWGQEAQIPQNLIKEKEQAARVHAIDPDIVLQACIFEIVTPGINQVAVPDWVFKAFNLPVETRNFKYDDIVYADLKQGRSWGSRPGSGNVPDVSRIETKMYFYYLGASYINAGIEGLHFGQVELMNKNDKDLAHYEQILNMIRDYAHKHARRGMIICDAHVPKGGFLRNGKLLFDVHAFPLRIKETPDKPKEATLEVGHTDALFLRSKGGISPSGWSCEHLPYIVEFDNYGSSRTPGKAGAGGFWIWGWDEISWFANQPTEYRQNWLHYAYDWIRKTDPNGHLEMPGGRQTDGGINGRWYFANNKSDATPTGMGDEDTIRDIWAANEGK